MNFCHDDDIYYKNAQKNRMEIELHIVILFTNYTIIK